MENPNPIPSENKTELLQELEELTQTLYQSHKTRRAASLVLPRSDDSKQGPPTTIGCSTNFVLGERSQSRSRAGRMSVSPWRSRTSSKNQQQQQQQTTTTNDGYQRRGSGTAVVEERKGGIWNWKPMRALSHITMQKMGCLFSVDVVAVQSLPASVNGLRLSVAVRKKETKEGTVQTLPARVVQGAAEFEETMFIRCTVYCTGGSGKPIKFEQRPFYISAVAVDAPELDFGKNTVDLSLLMKESMEKNMEGTRVRQWDRSFRLAGKAKGGELVVKLGFQIMEDGGVGIYANPDGRRTPMMSTMRKGQESPSFARRQSKSSFSITSPRIPPKSTAVDTVNHNEIDDFKLDDPAPTKQIRFTPKPSPARKAMSLTVDEFDLPDFDVVDRGIEVEKGEVVSIPISNSNPQRKEKRQEEGEEEEVKMKSIGSSEVIVKEVVATHHLRLTELDSIAKQLTALESMLAIEDHDYDSLRKNPKFLEADEDAVTRDFLNLLEQDDDEKRIINKDKDQDVVVLSTPKSTGSADEFPDDKTLLPDLGKGLGTVVRTKDGGYLVAANPFDFEVTRNETPKLAIQISKPMVFTDRESPSATGFELFRRMAAAGPEALGSALREMTAMDELVGKTAEQIAFEGIASAIVTGRNGEDGSASASATRVVAKLKSMSTRRGKRIWNSEEEAVEVDELLSLSLQRIEAMAVEAIKIQADSAEEDAPFEVSPHPPAPLASFVPLEEWTAAAAAAASAGAEVAVVVVVQARDPVRRYERVGGAVVAVVQAVGVGRKEEEEEDEEEEKYRVGSIHIGGVRMGADGGGGGWDGEKERLTAAQWLAACGMGKKVNAANYPGTRKGKHDLLWSLSCRIMADTWLRPMRNPDIKFPK